MLRMNNKMINQAVCTSAFVLYTNIKICAFPYLWSAAVIAPSRRIDCPARIDFFKGRRRETPKEVCSIQFSDALMRSNVFGFFPTLEITREYL